MAKSPSAIDPPYLRELLTFMFDQGRKYAQFELLEQARNALLRDRTTIQVTDLGAGSRVGGQSTTVSKIAHTALSGRQRCQSYFRLSVFLKAKGIMEIGTSLGLSTAYLATACRDGHVIGLEGDPNILNYARGVATRLGLDNITFVKGHFAETIPAVLQDIPHPDLVIIDGNHRREPTLHAFNLSKRHRHPDTVIVIDDIRWSEEMHSAWLSIAEDNDVTAVIDCYWYGIVLFREEYKRKVRLKIRTGTI